MKKKGRKEGRICEKKEEKRNWYNTGTSRTVYTLSIRLKVVCRLKTTPIEGKKLTSATLKSTNST